MKRYRMMPTIQYDLEAVEAWITKKSEQGLRLTQLFGPVAEFEKYEGPKIHYRVRYIRENREINGALFWGNMYVYQSTDPAELQERGPDEISMAKKAFLKPSIVSSVLLGIPALECIKQLVYDFEGMAWTEVVTSLLFIVVFFHILIRALRIATKL